MVETSVGPGGIIIFCADRACPALIVSNDGLTVMNDANPGSSVLNVAPREFGEFVSLIGGGSQDILPGQTAHWDSESGIMTADIVPPPADAPDSDATLSLRHLMSDGGETPVAASRVDLPVRDIPMLREQLGVAAELLGLPDGTQPEPPVIGL